MKDQIVNEPNEIIEQNTLARALRLKIGMDHAKELLQDRNLKACLARNLNVKERPVVREIRTEEISESFALDLTVVIDDLQQRANAIVCGYYRERGYEIQSSSFMQGCYEATKDGETIKIVIKAFPLYATMSPCVYVETTVSRESQ